MHMLLPHVPSMYHSREQYKHAAHAASDIEQTASHAPEMLMQSLSCNGAVHAILCTGLVSMLTSQVVLEIHRHIVVHGVPQAVIETKHARI